jgi:hypothetical protein
VGAVVGVVVDAVVGAVVGEVVDAVVGAAADAAAVAAAVAAAIVSAAVVAAAVVVAVVDAAVVAAVVAAAIVSEAADAAAADAAAADAAAARRRPGATVRDSVDPSETHSRLGEDTRFDGGVRSQSSTFIIRHTTRPHSLSRASSPAVRLVSSLGEKRVLEAAASGLDTAPRTPRARLAARRRGRHARGHRRARVSARARIAHERVARRAGDGIRVG